MCPPMRARTEGNREVWKPLPRIYSGGVAASNKDFARPVDRGDREGSPIELEPSSASDGCTSDHSPSKGRKRGNRSTQILFRVLSALVAGSMKDEIFQAASSVLKTVAVRRMKWNLR